MLPLSNKKDAISRRTESKLEYLFPLKQVTQAKNEAVPELRSGTGRCVCVRAPGRQWKLTVNSKKPAFCVGAFAKYEM